jgi:hypothetical protein
VLRLSEFTSLRLQPPPTGLAQGRSKIDFGKGVAYFLSRTGAEADIETPAASLNIRGTEFVIEVGENGKTTVTMVDGAVGMKNDFGAIDLADGEQGVAEPGKAPPARPPCSMPRSGSSGFFITRVSSIPPRFRT